MKKTIIVLILSLCAYVKTYSQNLITLSKQEVVKYMSEYTPEWNQTEKGIDYVLFRKGDEIYSVYYFNNEYGLCYKYLAIFPYSVLNEIIEGLNEKFVVYSENKWIDYNKTLDYIWILEREENHFTVVCDIYKIH